MATAPFGSSAWRATATVATLLAGALTLLSALTANVPWRDEALMRVEPGSFAAGAHVLAAAGGAALIVLSRGMAGGKRRAVDCAIVVLCAVAVLDLVKGLDYEEAGVSVSLALLLALGRPSFRRGSVSRPVLTAGLLAVGAAALAFSGDTIAMLGAKNSPGLGDAVSEAATSFVTGTWAGDEIGMALTVLVVAAFVASVVFLRDLLRPEPPLDGHSTADHEQAAALVGLHGRDSLDPFALREDKSFFFAHGGFLAYRTVGETAVISGDPIGPPGSAPAIVGDFARFARRRGWHVALTGASGRFLHAYRALGMRHLKVGAESVVDPREFSLEGRAIRKVRQSVTRAQREGWRVEVLEAADLTSSDVTAIGELESRWRDDQDRLYGFAMTLGRPWGAGEDRRLVYVLARHESGRIGALLRFAPYRGGLSLDSMRREHDTPNGLNEALVVAALAHARETGCEEVSLNFAGFAHIMRPAARLNWRQRVLRAVLRLAHGRFQLERLVRFNDKFGPEWRPRYLVYNGRPGLPRAGLRVLQAEAYLRAPAARPLSPRWRPAPVPATAARRSPIRSASA